MVRQSQVRTYIDSRAVCAYLDRRRPLLVKACRHISGSWNDKRFYSERDGNYLRLNPTIHADLPCNNYFGRVSAGTIYRTSTVMSLWRKSVLSDLLVSGESAWDFEINGTIRSDRFDGFYATKTDSFNVLNGIIKGKWRNCAYRKICKCWCTDFNDNRRARLSLTEELLLKIMIFRSKLLNLIPQYRRQLKSRILGAKHTYKVTTQDGLKHKLWLICYPISLQSCMIHNKLVFHLWL